MYCAIDFGTSNSAIAIPDMAGSMSLVPLEAGQVTMPTAVFYRADCAGNDGPSREFGRAAVAAYVDGVDGRLMRSLKSLLGSPLIDQTTDVGGGRGVKYLDILAAYLRHLKHTAQTRSGMPLDRVVLGRPVYFVDDDPVRDAAAQASLEAAAHQVGFREVRFQYEPIAAAFDYERGLAGEQRVLVADIGGGTSDFAVVRVGPKRAVRADRKDDILAHHGVHVAGADFDRRLELEAILPAFGYRARGPDSPGRTAPREVPSAIYFDLATWHLINTAYTPSRVAELRGMRGFYADPRHHERLMAVLNQRLGHELAAAAERAKIELAAGLPSRIDLDSIESRLGIELSQRQAAQAFEGEVEHIVEAASRTVQLSGLAPVQIDAVYFTGGSTGLKSLAQRIAAGFPLARVVMGDPFASVAKGLALHAARAFAPVGLETSEAGTGREVRAVGLTGEAPAAGGRSRRVMGR